MERILAGRRDGQAGATRNRSPGAKVAGDLRLPPEQAQEFRQRTVPEVANAAWEAFQPLEADIRDGVESQVARELGTTTTAEPTRRQAAAATAVADEGPTPLSTGDMSESTKTKPVIVFKPLVQRRHLWLGTGALLATASIALLALPLGTPVLPVYQATLNGQVQTRRGPEATPPPTERETFAFGNALGLVLRPETFAEGELEIRAYVDTGAGPEQLPLPEHELSESGSIRVRGVIGDDLVLPPGDSTLYFVAGRGRSLPSSTELREQLAGPKTTTRTDHWQAWRYRIRVNQQ